MQQREREVELLAGPARERLDAVAEVLREAELVEQAVARRARRALVEPVGLREQLEVLGDRELVPQQRLLRAVAEPGRADSVPPSRASRPTMTCISVLLPEPFSPTRPTSGRGRSDTAPPPAARWR